MTLINVQNVTLINGHPDAEGSYVSGLARSYREGAEETGARVEVIDIGNLSFDPILKYGYRKIMALEPDLLEAWEKIRRADHLVWIHPVWWGGLPALMKGFIDRLFVPGVAFKYSADHSRVNGELDDKSVRVIATMDAPPELYKPDFGEPGTRQLKESTMEFCGTKGFETTYLGPIRGSNLEQRQQWLDQVRRLGRERA